MMRKREQLLRINQAETLSNKEILRLRAVPRDPPRQSKAPKGPKPRRAVPSKSDREEIAASARGGYPSLLTF